MNFLVHSLDKNTSLQWQHEFKTLIVDMAPAQLNKFLIFFVCLCFCFQSYCDKWGYERLDKNAAWKCSESNIGKFHNSVNCDRPGECSPEKDCLRWPIISRDRRPIRQRPETYNIYWRFTVHLTLMMTSAQVVETSINVTSNSPSQDCTHPEDHN